MPTKDNLLLVCTWAFLAARLDFKAAKSLSALFKSDRAAFAGLRFNLFIILCGEGVEDTTVAEEVVEADVAVEVAAEAATTEASDISISFVNLAIMSVEEL